MTFKISVEFNNNSQQICQPGITDKLLVLSDNGIHGKITILLEEQTPTFDIVEINLEGELVKAMHLVPRQVHRLTVIISGRLLSQCYWHLQRSALNGGLLGAK
jgi:hypothetical protein